MTTQAEFIEDFRLFTSYDSTVFSDSEVQSLMSRAEKYIRRTLSDLDDSYDFLQNPKGEEALFWHTCLFAKVSTGELDSQTFQAGAIDQKELLAKAGDDVTTWYRNAKMALQALRGGDTMESTTVSRPDRDYQPDSFRDQTAGSSVDATDL